MRGLNNSDASALIGDGEAQDLSNVDITDNQSGIKKRDGYAQFRTIGTSTWGVRGAYYFRDVSGNDNLVHANNRSVFKSVNAAAYSAFITTDTAGSYYDFSDSQGYIYRFTNNRDEFVRWDGTTRTYFPSNPKGTQGEFTPSRLCVSGVSGTPNTIYFSQSGVHTNFTTGIEEADPFTFNFGLGGQSINALKYALGGLFVWTRNTMSVLSFSNQYDISPREISTTLGTIQPYSILYDNNTVYWQAPDGHFYSYDGNVIDRISQRISGSVANFPSSSQKAYSVNTAALWGAGTLSVGLSSTSTPGSISFDSSSKTIVDTFQDGTFSSNPTWTDIGMSVSAFGIESIGGDYNVYLASSTGWTGGSNAADVLYTANTNGKVGAWEFNVKSNGTLGTYNVSFQLCDSPPTDTAAEAGCYKFYISNTAYRIFAGGSQLATTAVTQNINTTERTFIVERSSTGVMGFYDNGILKLSATDTSITGLSYIGLGGSFVPADGTVTKIYYDDVMFDPFTSTYTYQTVRFTQGTATSWSAVGISQVLSSSTLTYAFYTDSDTSTDINNSATFTASQTVTNGTIPSIAVGSTATFAVFFNKSSIQQVPTVSEFSWSWFEGAEPANTIGSIDKDHRLFWSLTEGTSTVNNATYIYDTRFDSWLKYSVPMDGATRVGNALYFGGVSTGVVYQYPSGNTDDGTAITAYWKSKDFIGSDPFTEKFYNSFSLLAKTQTGSSLTVDAFVNGLATSTQTFTVSLTNSSSYPYIRFNERFRNGVSGSFINFKFGNAAGDSPFEFYSGRIDYTQKAWKVLP